MTGRSHRSILTTILLATFAIIGGTGRASAQLANACCTFRIVVSNLVPTPCMPISVTTNWGTPPATSQQTDVVTVKGNANPPLPIIPCATATQLNWVSLDGGITKFSFPSTPPGGYKITLPCGFCITLNATIDINGCIIINLSGGC